MPRKHVREQKNPRPVEVSTNKENKMELGIIKKKMILNQPDLLILEFKSTGEHCFREMKREQILNEARMAIPSKSITNIKKSKSVGTLRARDMRILDTSFSCSHDPSIVVRRHSILVNLPPIKSLIIFDKCYIVVPNGADSILAPLMEKLQHKSSQETHGFESFDLKSIEAIFQTVSLKLDKELQELLPKVEAEMCQVNTGKANLDSLRKCKIQFFFSIF